MRKKILAVLIVMAMTAQTKAQTSPSPAFRSLAFAHFLPADFAGAELDGFSAPEFKDGVFRLAKTDLKKPQASLISREIRTAFPFNQLLMSANADLGPGDAARLEARVKTAAGWSPWFSFGLFSPGASASSAGQENEFGKMEIDVLTLKEKASSLIYRFTLDSKDNNAALRLVSAAYTDTLLPFNEASAVKKTSRTRAIKLDIPRYSQALEQVNYSGDICSPVSLAMVLNYYGLKEQPLITATAVFDAPANIYGNWTFNTAYAGARGLYAFLARPNSMAEAEAYLSRGIALIASITFGPGELKNSPLKKTKGHLVVIKGFDAKGNVLVNDPASTDEKDVERVYDRKEFARAWLKNKFGTSYAVSQNLGRFLAVKTPSAEMFSMPPDGGGESKNLVETQLLFNEQAAIVETRGEWAKIEAGEQMISSATAKGAKELQPYSGWIKIDDLAFFPPLEPDAVIRVKNSGTTAEGANRTLSLGTKFTILSEKSGRLKMLGADSASYEINAGDANRLPLGRTAPGLRKNILAAARMFLKDGYSWGGRSAWNIDCSGLVNLAFRAWGIDLPRNAADQFRRAKVIERQNLKPADLVFSAEKDSPKNITHVMLYAGAGRLIEATRDTGSVREISFREKFGTDLEKVKNGTLINGKKIFFRAVLE